MSSIVEGDRSGQYWQRSVAWTRSGTTAVRSCRLQATRAQAFINSGSLTTPFAATASVLERSSSVSIPISSALASPAFRISGNRLRTVAAAIPFLSAS